ncbi:hypothetical protein D3C76_1817900 [compost metagenome]
MLDITRHVTTPLLSNYPEIPDSCHLLQFTLCEHIAYVFADGSHILVEQLRHLPLGQPDGLPFQSYLGEVFAFMLVDQYG